MASFLDIDLEKKELEIAAKLLDKHHSFFIWIAFMRFFNSNTTTTPLCFSIGSEILRLAKKIVIVSHS